MAEDLRKRLADIRHELDKYDSACWLVQHEDATFSPTVERQGCAVANACRRMAAAINREMCRQKQTKDRDFMEVVEKAGHKGTPYC